MTFHGLNIELDENISPQMKQLIQKRIMQTLIKEKLVEMKVMSDKESPQGIPEVPEAKNEEEESDG